MTAWASFDSPWVHMVDILKYAEVLEQIQHLNPRLILSSHLPTAQNRTRQLLGVLRDVPLTLPLEAPNQSVFQKILAERTEIITY